MEHHIAEFRLNVMEEETPVQLWRTSVPIPTSDAAIDLLKPLKALGDLCTHFTKPLQTQWRLFQILHMYSLIFVVLCRNLKIKNKGVTYVINSKGISQSGMF